MNFQISGLPLERFTGLIGLDDASLARRGALRYTVDAKPSFPCRITLEDADIGETVLLLNFEHQPTDTPYRASHAIYVRERAVATATFVDRVPPSLRDRPLSVRAFDVRGMMLDADLATGTELEPLIERFFANDEAAYLHAHYARRGCFAARVDRA